MIYFSRFLLVITLFLACHYDSVFCQELEDSHIHPSELPTLGTELIQDRSIKVKVTKKKPRWKFFSNIGWYLIPQFSETENRSVKKKRKRGNQEIERRNPDNIEYISEYFTQKIVLRALNKVKHKHNTKFGVKASILYTSTRGANFRSYFFQTPDQETELSAHVRLKVINRLGTTFYYEISYRQGLLAIMPFVVEDIQKSKNYSIAWYLTDSFEDKEKSLGCTATLLNAKDKPENGIQSLQKHHKYTVDRMSELLSEQFSLIGDIGEGSVEKKIEQIKERIMELNNENSDYGQVIIENENDTHHLIISRWDDNERQYIAYPFNTEALTNSELSNLFTD